MSVLNNTRKSISSSSLLNFLEIVLVGDVALNRKKGEGAFIIHFIIYFSAILYHSRHNL